MRIVQVYSKMKMLKVIVIALFALLLVAVRASPLQQKYESIQIIQLEESCVLQGGLCVRADDCDPENTPLLGSSLCPKQKHLGITCCYL